MAMRLMLDRRGSWRSSKQVTTAPLCASKISPYFLGAWTHVAHKMPQGSHNAPNVPIEWETWTFLCHSLIGASPCQLVQLLVQVWFLQCHLCRTSCSNLPQFDFIPVPPYPNERSSVPRALRPSSAAHPTRKRHSFLNSTSY